MARQVWPGLYLGGLASVYAAAPLPFKVVVNVAKEITYDEDVQDSLKKQKVQIVKLSMTDDDKFQLADADKTIDEIHQHIQQKIPVLVHCLMGASRSVSVVIRYLIRYEKHTYDTALAHLHCFCWCYRPNASFEKQLRAMPMSV